MCIRDRGGMNDWELTTKILERSISLKDYFKSQENNWEKPRVGLNGDIEKPDFTPENVIDARLITCLLYTSRCV